MKLNGPPSSSDYTKMLKASIQANLSQSDKSQGIVRPQSVTSGITPSSAIPASAAQNLEFLVTRCGTRQPDIASVFDLAQNPFIEGTGCIGDIVPPTSYAGITIATAPVGIYTISGNGSSAGPDGFQSLLAVHVSLFDNCIYFVDNVLNSIFKISTDGTISTVLNTGLNDPRTVVQSCTGDLYIANQGAKNILKFSYTTNSLSIFVGAGGVVPRRVNKPESIALDYHNNYLYTADNTLLGEGGTDPLWRGYAFSPTVWRIPLLNPYRYFPLQSYSPTTFVACSATSLYLLAKNRSLNRMSRIQDAINASNFVAPSRWDVSNGYSGDGGPVQNSQIDQFGFAVTHDERYMYIACGSANVIRRVDLTTDIITTVVGNGTSGSADSSNLLSANLSSTYDVKVDLYGNLVIADIGNKRIRYAKLT
jgi:hypothetical protein